MIVYRIRAANEQYSKGGSQVGPWSFGKKGKTWNSMAAVTLHLAQLNRDSLEYYNRVGATLIEIEVTEKETSSVPIHVAAVAAAERKAKRENDQRIRREEHAKKERQKAYIKLQQEFGDTSINNEVNRAN